MFKSCNSDTLAYVCLTNENIQAFVDSLSPKVEEITFWNYKMCLDPQLLHEKEEVLLIPSLERFAQLKCVKFYSERIEVETTVFPPKVERVFFIACLLKNQWMNVCVYRKNLTHLDQYYSKAIYVRPILGFLPPLLSTTKKPTPPVLRRRPRRRKSLWKFMTNRCLCGWRFSPLFCRISPENEIEMTNFVALPPVSIELPVSNVSRKPMIS